MPPGQQNIIIAAHCNNVCTHVKALSVQKATQPETEAHVQPRQQQLAANTQEDDDAKSEVSVQSAIVQKTMTRIST